MPPLTGLVGIYGQEIVCAARVACEEINERGGLLGRPLELVIEDDGSLPDTAVPAAEKLLDQYGCVALIGNLLSNSRIAVAARVAEPRRIPYLNFSFYEGSISGRYFFHFAALPNQQIDKMIPFMLGRYGPKMFFAGSNYEWPRGSIDAAKRILQRSNGEIVGEAYLPIGAPEELIDTLLSEVARSGADVFVPYFAGDDQIKLLTRFTDLGLKPRMAVVMGHYDEVMVSRLPPAVREGFYSSNTYFMSLDTKENLGVLKRLARQPGINGVWPHGNGMMTNFGEGAYLCVHAFASAVVAAGSTEPEALVDALERTHIAGPQGNVDMDALTHHASVNTFLARCNADGAFTIIERFGRIPPRIPERYREAFAESAMQRESGALSSDKRISPHSALPQTVAANSGARSILAIADAAVLATDAEGIISDANPRACTMFGYAEAELVGMSVHFLLPPHFRARHVEMVRRFVESDETERRMSARGEVTGYRKDGSFFPVEASIAKSKSGSDWLLVVTLHDITERKRTEEELVRRATHDVLTGLPNRALIRERLTAAMQRSRRSGLSVALLFIDLDGFKPINDLHGHAAGDLLLRTVSSRLIELVRPGDTVARLAGDEFVVMCEQVEQPDTISALAQRIVEAMRLPVHHEGNILYVTASIGVAIGSGGLHSADDMLRFADTAMYAAKEKGRDTWQFFDQKLQDQARSRLAITHGLRTAMVRQEFSIRFQPIVEAVTGRIAGAEMLLRWRPPDGEISPALFIPVAEMTGMIVQIGEWVFREACRAEAVLRERWGTRAPYISVNVSARQLNDHSLVRNFAAILEETSADPSRLLLEITESSLMADVESNLRVLNGLARLGLRVAVDDFGTGYSSLAQLTRLPVDVLKIDKAFIDDIASSPESRAVVRAIIGLGRSLGLKLVAEGVESESQQFELNAFGCDLIQGYLFHRPIEEAAFLGAVANEMTSEDADGMAPLHCLIYVSRATGEMTDTELAELIDMSRIANHATGTTGLLIYRDGCFAQMLEGRREVLHALMEKIRRDGRHTDIRVVLDVAAKQRVFLGWDMGLRYCPPAEDASAPEAGSARRISLYELGDDPGLLHDFFIAHAGPRFFD